MNALRLAALAAAIIVPGLASAQGITVESNQAKIVKLARPADTVVVGNPKIADAAVQDETTIVLTGKGFGVTNLVVLGADGTAIVDEQVTVVRQRGDSVRLYRRAEVQTFSCSPNCEPEFQGDKKADAPGQLIGD